MKIMNTYSSSERKPRNVYDYEARRLRKAMEDETITIYPEITIFRDILETYGGILKREELITVFATRENCTTKCASELFGRVRKELLLTDVVQPDHGYYCLAKYYNE